jgi:hypothetical protein
VKICLWLKCKDEEKWSLKSGRFEKVSLKIGGHKNCARRRRRLIRLFMFITCGNL